MLAARLNSGVGRYWTSLREFVRGTSMTRKRISSGSTFEYEIGLSRCFVLVAGILAVNIALGGLALASSFLFLFRGDPILAAAPAILALPIIILQPWFIAFFLLPGGPLLAPLLTTAVSVPVYVVLERKGKLERAKLLLTRLKTRQALLVSSAIVALLVLVGFSRYVDFPSIHKGIPGTLQYSIKDMDINVGAPRYYCLGAFMDSEWLWQACLPEQDVDALTSKLSMHPIAIDQISDQYQNMPPYWWRPVISDQVRAFATTHFQMDGRGSDGWHALATWNPENEVLHMWIKDNF